MAQGNIHRLNYKLILAFLAATALGTGIFLNLNQIITLIQQNASPIVNMVAPVTTRIQQGLASLPQEYRAFLMGTVPLGLLSLGYAWWKNRQMSNLAKQSLEKIQELNAANLDIQTQATRKLTTLQSQVDEYRNMPNQTSLVKTLETELSDLRTNLQESSGIISQQAQELTLYRTQGTMDYVRKLQEQLKINNIPIPSYEGTVVTQVK